VAATNAAVELLLIANDLLAMAARLHSFRRVSRVFSKLNSLNTYIVLVNHITFTKNIGFQDGCDPALAGDAASPTRFLLPFLI
jgi:hypothetical protein